MSIADPIILKAFFNESAEAINSLENDLSQLETDLTNENLLNSVFRALHTLKGNSSFLDLNQLTEMTHEAETILDRIRNRDDQLTQETIDVIFQVVEALRAMVANPEGKIDTAPVMKSLLEYSQSNRSVVPSSTAKNDAMDAPLGEKSSPYQVVPTIRIEEVKLERIVNLVNELKILRFALEAIPAAIIASGSHSRELAFSVESGVSKLARISGELSALAYGARLVPTGQVFRKFPRIVRDLAAKLNKEIKLSILDDSAELDKSIIEAVADPMIHLIRNSCDHGIESAAERTRLGKSPVGSIILNSYLDVNAVVIEIRDDGRGIDTELVTAKAVEKGIISAAKAKDMTNAERLGLIFAPGFSTATQVTSVSGRGVGMDVVKSNINRLKGTVAIESTKGVGTVIQLRFPLSVVVIRCLYVLVGDFCYSVPLQQVSESLMVTGTSLHKIMPDLPGDSSNVVLPIYFLESLLWNHGQEFTNLENISVLRVRAPNNDEYGLVVDRFSFMEEAVIQSVDSYISSIPGIQGGIIRKDGTVTVALNLDGLHEEIKRKRPSAYVIAAKLELEKTAA